MTTGRLGSLCFGLILACAWVTAVHGSTLVRGQNRTCHDFADLDFALDHPNARYFDGWTTEDFDAAEKWVASCVAAPPTHSDQERQALLARRRHDLEVRGDTQRNDQRAKELHDQDWRDQQDQEGRDAQMQAQQVEQEAGLAAKRAQYAECGRSRAYQRFQAELRVVEALDRIADAQANLEREKRIEEATATTNLYSKRAAGEALVDAQDDLQRWWAVYRQYGGEAPTPRSLRRPPDDPCGQPP
ncbi:MAG TPA: hypothetical protein VI653_25055 [Steroidobacteraceae bacterium]